LQPLSKAYAILRAVASHQGWHGSCSIPLVSNSDEFLKGKNMLEVSEIAKNMIKDFMKEKGQQKPVRIVFTQSECDQPAMGLALSEAQEQDNVFDLGDISFVVEGPLCDMAGPFQIDSVETLSGLQLYVSSSIAESTVHMAEDPDSCKAYCMTCTCQDDDPLEGLSLHGE
jgi:Fe-S cluster assembly iron-binding protein IscA